MMLEGGREGGGGGACPTCDLSHHQTQAEQNSVLVVCLEGKV